MIPISPRTVVSQLGCALIAAAVVSHPALGQNRTMSMDGYAASVNDRVILKSEVRSRIKPDQTVVQNLSSEEEAKALLDAMYAEALDTLIAQALILEEYEQSKGEVPEKAVDERIKEILHDGFNDDRVEMLEELRDQQITMEEWREQIREQLIVAIMRRSAVFDQIDVSPATVQSLYEERLDQYREPAKAKVRMIKIRLPDPAEATATTQQEQVDSALERLQSGEAFADVARALSHGLRAQNGGDWGWIPTHDLRKELADAIETLPLGEVSPVITAGDDKYLILVEDRMEESCRPIEDVRADLLDELWRTEAERLNSEWVVRLKKKHFVKIY